MKQNSMELILIIFVFSQNLNCFNRCFQKFQSSKFFPSHRSVSGYRTRGHGEGPEATRITCTVSMGTRKYFLSGLNFTGGSPPDRTDIVRKETQIKVSALCISYFRTVQTFLEAEVATSHPKCNTSLESPC